MGDWEDDLVSMTRRKVEDRLSTAMRARLPVTLRRCSRLVDVHGFVVGLSDGWAVLHCLIEDVHLDAVMVLRIDQVEKVERHPSEAYVVRAVAGLGTALCQFELVTGATALDVLGAARDRSRVVAMSYLDQGHHWRECGVIRRVGQPKFEFHHIDPDGAWAQESGLRVLEHVTAIEVGGLALTALDRFEDADPLV